MIAPQALFFPDVDLSPIRLAQALLLFDRIILFNPPGGQPTPFLTAAMDLSLVELIPATFFDDESELRRILASYASLADLYRDPAYLAMLKARPADDFESSTSELVARLRHGGLQPQGLDSRRAAQVYLHLARDLDRQQSEIMDLLAQTRQKEGRLADLLGVEPLADLDRPPEILPPSTWTFEEDLSGRLTAWGHLFSEFGRAVPLITDRPQVTATLDENLARHYRSPLPPEGRLFEVLETLVEIPMAGWDLSADPIPTVEVVMKRRERNGVWMDFMAKVAAKSWGQEELVSLKEEAASLFNRVSSLETGTSGSTMVVTVHLLPGEDIKSAYLAAVGLRGSHPLENMKFSGPVFTISSDF